MIINLPSEEPERNGKKRGQGKIEECLGGQGLIHFNIIWVVCGQPRIIAGELGGG